MISKQFGELMTHWTLTLSMFLCSIYSLGCDDQNNSSMVFTLSSAMDMHFDDLLEDSAGHLGIDMEKETEAGVAQTDLLDMYLQVDEGGVFYEADMTFIDVAAGAEINLDLDHGIMAGEQVEVDMLFHSNVTAFVDRYWSATHNSYEGGQRGTITEQLNQGIRALEYDIHDNNFQSEGYRLGHFQFGDAVAYGNGNPNTDALGSWLDVINDWSNQQNDHAPLILTIDLKDNLMDNRSYEEGNLAHLNDVLVDHLDRIWRPSQSLDDVEAARHHLLCVLSGDAATRRGYLYDPGFSPALSINQSGQVLEVHDSGSGNLWYWSGFTSVDTVIWKRHGRYDSGQRPVVLTNASGAVIEVHQSESRERLWASTGHLDSAGELTLNSARDFSDGLKPSLRWRDQSQGLFSLRYERNGQIYEREGSAHFSNRQITWSSERLLSNTSSLFEREIQIFQGKTYRVSNRGAIHGYPSFTLWLSVSNNNRSLNESAVRYEQLCFVEWQRMEYNDDLLGLQIFGALPGGSYRNLPEGVRANKIIRGWEFSGRNPLGLVPQIPSTDTPYTASYQQLLEDLEVME